MIKQVPIIVQLKVPATTLSIDSNVFVMLVLFVLKIMVLLHERVRHQ